MKLPAKIIAILDSTNDFLALMASVLLIFLMLSISADVVMRYFLKSPMIWVLESSEFSLLFITFLGAAWLLKTDGHIKLEILLTRLTPRTQALLNAVTSILGAIACLATAWYSAQSTWGLFQISAVTVTNLRLPKGPIVAIIPIGSFLLFLQFLRRSFEHFKKWKNQEVTRNGLESKSLVR